MRRVLATMTCLAALITVSGCSGGSVPLSSQSGGATRAGGPVTPAPKMADPPTAFNTNAGVPLPADSFSTNVAGSVTAKFLTLRDRTAYIVAPTGLTAVDVLTGKQRWTTPIKGTPGDPDNQSGPFVNTTGPRPPVVTDKLAVAAVPVEMPEQGTTPAYITLTVLAADATTGKKAWQADTKVPTDQFADASNAVTKVVAVTDKAVIASYDGQEEGHLTVALDPVTGRTLWTRQDYSGGGVYGDTLVGVDSNLAENSSMSQATALDVATGQQKWVAAKESEAINIIPAAPSVVVVDQKDYRSGATFLLFLDPATGAERTRLTGPSDYTATNYGDCYYDEQSVLVCFSSDVLTGYDAATARKLWSLPDQSANRVAPGVTVVWHGVLYGTTESDKPIALDAKTGKDLSTDVGVIPYWVSKYAGIGVSSGGAPMAYPVTK